MRAYLEFLHRLLASRASTRHLDEVGGVDIGKLVGVGRLADAVVRPGAGELHLSAGAVLELVEVLAAATDESAVLSGRNGDTEDHAVTQTGDDLLELGLDLGNELGFAAQDHLIGRFRLARAEYMSVSMRNIKLNVWDVQSDETSLSLGIGRSTATSDEFLETLSTGPD